MYAPKFNFIHSAGAIIVVGVVSTPLSIGCLWLGKMVKNIKVENPDSPLVTINRLGNQALKALAHTIKYAGMLLVGYCASLGVIFPQHQYDPILTVIFSLIFMHGLLQVHHKYSKPFKTNG